MQKCPIRGTPQRGYDRLMGLGKRTFFMARSSRPSRRAKRLHPPSNGLSGFHPPSKERLGLKMRFLSKQFSSLENIAPKLVKLEKEWSVLGPNREINFTYTFGNPKTAEIFASVVEEKGCKFWISSCGNPWYVVVSRIMEPLATNVLFWQELLDLLAPLKYNSENSDGYCYSRGWSYPHKKDILFLPPSSFKTKIGQTADQLVASHLAARHRAASERAAVLFGSKLLADSFCTPKQPCFRRHEVRGCKHCYYV